MSSMCRSTHTSTPFSSQLCGPHESTDQPSFNNRHLSSAASESTHIPSPNYSQTFSNSVSPSHNTHSTPGESLSEESNYQLSDFGNPDDEFLGVNFDIGIKRVYSIPTEFLGGAEYQLATFDQSLAGLPTHLENGLSFQGLNNSHPALTPRVTDIPSTSRRQKEGDIQRDTSGLPHDEYNSKHHNSTTRSLTPGVGGSSQRSGQSAGPSIMVGFDIGDPLGEPKWQNQQAEFEPNVILPSAGHYGDPSHSNYYDFQFPGIPGEQASKAVGVRNDEGIWESSDQTGQAGLDPESRKAIADMEVPNLKQQDEIRRVDDKNVEVQEWRSHAGGDSETTSEVPDEDQNIQPVDDAASIRENTLVEDQVYFHLKNNNPTEADKLLMHQPRQWVDAPAVPYMTTTKLQPSTANEAMRKWEASADTFSLASRVATWGTHRRRCSEPSLSDIDAIHDGSILKKLSISKPKESERHRSNSLLDQGLVRLASIVRNKKDARRKRSRSTENENGAPPPQLGTRSPSFSKKTSPGLNTTPAVLGTLHIPGGSPLGGSSPKSPINMNFARSVIRRARSRSELSNSDKAGVGIVGLWRGQGGPPVPSLTSPPLEFQATQARAEVFDHEDDDDDDDEQADDNDVDIKTEEQSGPILPNYEGFKAHVRRLNPDMDLSECSWLVSRIGRQQEARYKALLELRLNHFRSTMAHSCTNGHLCRGRGAFLNVKGYAMQPERNVPDLQLVTEFSDDSIPEGTLTNDAFPKGVPMPPIRTLPAEFECQLCFKVKKFQKPSDWTKHIHEDLQPFTCTFNKCKEPKSFKRKADWVRHENERHRRLEWWKCEVNDCGHICYRKDNFLQHLVREHKFIEPLQKTKAAVKKSLPVDPAWDMLERCHHETPDKPQSEPCKFCGKMFNSWKKLMVHNAKHMEKISLPVLQLVDAANVDANTIISPIDQISTPITPVRGPKMESVSPFMMDNLPSHVSPMIPQFSPPYLPTTTSSTMYGMPATIPQTINYNQTTIYSNPPGTQPMAQDQNFQFSDPFGMGNMGQADTFISPNTGFPSSLPAQSYGTSQPGYPTSTNYTSHAPSVSGHQFQYHVTDPSLYDDFDSMDPTPHHNFDSVPTSQAQGNVQSYGYPQQKVPHKGPYYGNPL